MLVARKTEVNMVKVKNQRKVETKMVTSILNKALYGEDPKKVEAAEKVLRDTQLFNKYIDIRIERRNEAQRIKEGRLTVWERIVRFTSRKA